MRASSSRQFVISLSLACLCGPLMLGAQSKEGQVDQLLAIYDQARSPGCSVGVIQSEGFVYRKSHGFGSLELHVPLSPESVFYMGSVSKQFTAASVVLAAEMGFLTLDDEVHKFIPELPKYGHPITLRQMLHQTSGFRDFLTLLYMAGQQDSGFRARDVLELVVRQKDLNNVPGEEFIYSNTNYFLLGVVVERATGKPLARFAKEFIFEPLGMTHTRFADDRTAVIPDRVPAYDYGPAGTFSADSSSTFDIVGAGGLMSNVDDMRLWANNFHQDRLGKGSLMRELQTPGFLNNGRRISYALGLELGSYGGSPTVGHNGSLFGYRSEILRFPQQDLTIVCLCNLSSVATGSLARKIADVYLPAIAVAAGGISPDVPAPGGMPDAAQFAGQYLDPYTHTLFSFTTRNDDLVGWGTTLHRIDARSFHDLGTGIITFNNSGKGTMATLTMDGKAVFIGSRVVGPNLTKAVPSDLSGTYSSSELGVRYSLSLEKGALILHDASSVPRRLIPVTGSDFEAGDLGAVVFQRGSHGQVIGLRVFSQNVRGITFKKDSGTVRSVN